MNKDLQKSYWIWYPGDFERYHAMKQNFSRVERGAGWPAFWKSEGFHNRVVFRKSFYLQEPAVFTVYSRAIGFVLVQDRKYPFGREIVCGPGEQKISVHAACIETFPCIYIEGDGIRSDDTWMAEDYDEPPVLAGFSRNYTEKEQDPAVWNYTEKKVLPILAENTGGGVLFTFETEMTAQIKVLTDNGMAGMTVYCGESKEEALDTVHCYHFWNPDEDGLCPRCAVRYVFIPGRTRADVQVEALYQYVDFPVKTKFHCNDEQLNRIWDVAEHTLRLCSGIFFIDGIKRDQWIWCGDTYQNILVNPCLLADPDIDQRTLLALRGNDPMTTHINTIVDYTLIWVLAVREHYQSFGDLRFLRRIWPKVQSLMAFCEEQLDRNGFLTGRKKDWIYIDWADLDKTGPLCAEQMFFAAAYGAMEEMASFLGEYAAGFSARKKELVKKIRHFYWNAEKGAFIDSFVSGKKQVTRHANILAVVYGIADEKEKESILHNVILNDQIPAITTPYFQFFELDALCRLGYLDLVLEKIRSYWGGMLERGAATFWEEYDPSVPEEEQYDMYGDRFGKSMCHAWAASPIYFFVRYFLGLTLTEPGGAKYTIRPHTEFFESFDCHLNVGSRILHLVWDGKEFTCEEEEK